MKQIAAIVWLAVIFLDVAYSLLSAPAMVYEVLAVIALAVVMVSLATALVQNRRAA